jgi:signal transduction histidine kinase/CheY-like chemotaxis protein
VIVGDDRADEQSGRVHADAQAVNHNASASGAGWAGGVATATAAATLLALLLPADAQGPDWIAAAPWLAALTLALLVLALVLQARQERQLRAHLASAQRDARTVPTLQHELDVHTRLESELRTAKQAAEAAAMAKGEFLATMSHEIRTPLNGVVPMLDLLMNAKLAPDHRELVRTAFASSQQLLRIVDDILDYSKLEADRLALESTAFNLRELLDSVLEMMERPAEAKGLRLHLQIDGNVRLPVRGDPVRLRQVLTNLLGNAIKFTERGTVTVAVRRVQQTAAQHRLRFEVRDTGIGIEPEAQQRLFQAFNQADASTTRLYGGTGLGLAICKRIVELMDGRIGVESEPRHGSTFWFEIPLLKVHGDIASADRIAEGGRLLLVSNDQRLRTRLGMLLPNWGFRVTAVETTQEALDRLRTSTSQGAQWSYSVVLADLAGMRGTALALARSLERRNLFGHARLVCLYGDEDAPEELRRSATVLSRQAPDADLRQALSTQDDATKPQAHAAPPSGIPQASSLRHARVLLVEDNPVNLMVGQRLLGVLGVNCDTAGNGEIAIMRMSACRYDLVLMDCQMPVLDGYAATRRWRENEAAAGSRRRIPIVAMTANAMAGDRQKCLDAGMDDYLSKPVTRAELERCLHRWCKPRAKAEQPEHAQPEQMPPDGDLPQAPPETQAEPAPLAMDQMAASSVWGAAAPLASPPAAEASRPLETAMQREDPLDRSALDELREVLGGDVRPLIDSFLDDTPRLVARLESAAAGPDYALLSQAAHSLKSSSANLGAMGLSAAAKRIELGARAGTLDRPAVAVALLAREFERVRAALLAYPASGD